MKIKIIGAGFKNKGAELMIYAINAQIQKRYHPVDLVLPINNRNPLKDLQ